MWITILLIVGIIIGLAIAFGVTMLLISRIAERKSTIKKVGVVKQLPPKKMELFLLSRYNIMEHIEAMQTNSARFVITPNIKKREKKTSPDHLLCGKCCFGIVFEHNDYVHNIGVRLNSNTASILSERHSLASTRYLSNEDWYNLAIDNTFKTKKEVYKILNMAYDYVSTK